MSDPAFLEKFSTAKVQAARAAMVADRQTALALPRPDAIPWSDDTRVGEQAEFEETLRINLEIWKARMRAATANYATPWRADGKRSKVRRRRGRGTP